MSASSSSASGALSGAVPHGRVWWFKYRVPCRHIEVGDLDRRGYRFTRESSPKHALDKIEAWLYASRGLWRNCLGVIPRARPLTARSTCGSICPHRKFVPESCSAAGKATFLDSRWSLAIERIEFVSLQIDSLVELRSSVVLATLHLRKLRPQFAAPLPEDGCSLSVKA